MVEVNGIEPMTFPLKKRDALPLLIRPCSLSELSGGGERDRTDDLLRAKQVLSQLSYTPNGIDDFILTIVDCFFQ